MDSDVVRVGQHIGVQVPLLQVIGDVVAELFEYGSAEVFRLSTNLQVVRRGDQVLGSQYSKYAVKELRVRLFSIARQQPNLRDIGHYSTGHELVRYAGRRYCLHMYCPCQL